MQETLNIGEHGGNVNIHEISKNIIKIFSMNILCVIFLEYYPVQFVSYLPIATFCRRRKQTNKA